MRQIPDTVHDPLFTGDFPLSALNYDKSSSTLADQPAGGDQVDKMHVDSPEVMGCGKYMTLCTGG